MDLKTLTYLSHVSTLLSHELLMTCQVQWARGPSLILRLFFICRYISWEANNCQQVWENYQTGSQNLKIKQNDHMRSGTKDAQQSELSTYRPPDMIPYTTLSDNQHLKSSALQNSAHRPNQPLLTLLWMCLKRAAKSMKLFIVMFKRLKTTMINLGNRSFVNWLPYINTEPVNHLACNPR